MPKPNEEFSWRDLAEQMCEKIAKDCTDAAWSAALISTVDSSDDVIEALTAFKRAWADAIKNV